MVTRFYFHEATDSTTGLPTDEQSALEESSASARVDAITTNRSMTTTIGASQTEKAFGVSLAGTDTIIYYTRFVSPPIFQTSVAANTWTYNFAALETNVAANFPVSGNNKVVNATCYVWRPGGGGSLVGTILDGNTAATVDEGGANAEVAHHVTFTGAQVLSTQNNDVIIFEVWFTVTNGAANAFCRFYYDGTTANTTDNASVSNHASFLETPEDLVLTAPSGDTGGYGAQLFEMMPQLFQT